MKKWDFIKVYHYILMPLYMLLYAWKYFSFLINFGLPQERLTFELNFIIALLNIIYPLYLGFIIYLFIAFERRTRQIYGLNMLLMFTYPEFFQLDSIIYDVIYYAAGMSVDFSLETHLLVYAFGFVVFFLPLVIYFIVRKRHFFEGRQKIFPTDERHKKRDPMKIYHFAVMPIYMFWSVWRCMKYISELGFPIQSPYFIANVVIVLTELLCMAYVVFIVYLFMRFEDRTKNIYCMNIIMLFTAPMLSLMEGVTYTLMSGESVDFYGNIYQYLLVFGVLFLPSLIYCLMNRRLFEGEADKALAETFMKIYHLVFLPTTLYWCAWLGMRDMLNFGLPSQEMGFSVNMAIILVDIIYVAYIILLIYLFVGFENKTENLYRMNILMLFTCPAVLQAGSVVMRAVAYEYNTPTAFTLTDNLYIYAVLFCMFFLPQVAYFMKNNELFEDRAESGER